MFRIERISLRNFKSFKRADVELPNNFICFAGPNGSGKSNLCDAIRFALGETSLKSLRVKNSRQLIHKDAKSASVILVFKGEDGKRYEIKRIIRDDGKLLYSINGEKTTRSALMELLIRHGIDGSGRNVIAQGEVAHIIHMGGKERRAIIDAVAGVSSFENKKKEALAELDVVESRIKEARVVLSERKSFLAELEEEKNRAERFLALSKKRDRLKKNVLGKEAEKLRRFLEEWKERKKQFEESIAALSSKTREIEEKIGELEKKRSSLSDSLRNRESAALLKRREQLLTQKAAYEKLLEERKREEATIEKSIYELSQSIAEKEKERALLSQTLSELEARLGERIESRKKAEEIKSKLGEVEKELAVIEKELEQLPNAPPPVMEEKAQLERCEGRLKELFEETRRINKELGEVEKELLYLREQASLYKVKASALNVNQTLLFINELGIKGVFGAVVDLIDFDEKYAIAVEAAAGNRLFYVVVDSTDTALRVIKELKKEKMGRATFIPIDRIAPPPPIRIKGVLSLADVVDYPPEVEKAIHYVFGSTLVVENAEKAKTLRERVVTLEGELFERSGIISGGRSGGAPLLKAKKIEEKLREAKQKREALLKTLYELREEEGKLRSERGRLEALVRVKENEVEKLKEAAKRRELLSERRSRLLSSKRQLENELNMLGTSDEGEELSRFSEVKGKLSRIEGVLNELYKRKKADGERKRVIRDEIRDACVQLDKLNSLLEELDKKQREESEKVDSLLGELRKIEEVIAKYTSEFRVRLKEKEALERDFQKESYEAASVETRLKDLEEELNKLEGEEEEEGTLEMLSEVERELELLGPVNLSSIEVYEKKAKEIAEVEGKISSLEEERKAILEMIAEIEERKRDAFYRCFDGVNRNFKELFKKIDLGEGYLYLNRPREPFESGLFIKLRRGNKEESLDSLSGGEKTLVALMFIFSLQLYKPSPFYILDEVDAALDKLNSKNFASLIRELGKGSQFIVVSHNDNVVSEAESIVGVSKVDGVSKLVSVLLQNA